MLSVQEYQKTLWQLDNIPDSITGKNRKNLRATFKRKIHEHEVSSTYPPFEPLSHTQYFINRTTTEEMLQQLIQTATTSTEFTMDTESINIYRQGNKPVLIQLQFSLPHDPSVVNIIEMCHLPPEHDIRFKLLKQLFQIIFSEEKKLYIWGSTAELFPFIKFKLFSYEQIDSINCINLQDDFKKFWNQRHVHRSKSGNGTCQCENCLDKLPSEPWSLQDATALELHEYLSKILTNQNFNIGLDPNLWHMNSSEINHRQQLTIYASNDCLSMEKILISMKNKKFKFSVALNKKIPYNNMESIFSSGNDENDEIMFSQLTSSIERLGNNRTVIFGNQEPLTSTITHGSFNWKINSTNDNQPTNQQPPQTTQTTTPHETRNIEIEDEDVQDIEVEGEEEEHAREQLSLEERKRIHNRT